MTTASSSLVREPGSHRLPASSTGGDNLAVSSYNLWPGHVRYLDTRSSARRQWRDLRQTGTARPISYPSGVGKIQLQRQGHFPLIEKLGAVGVKGKD